MLAAVIRLKHDLIIYLSSLRRHRTNVVAGLLAWALSQSSPVLATWHSKSAPAKRVAEPHTTPSLRSRRSSNLRDGFGFRSLLRLRGGGQEGEV